ncbi:MAG: HAMP domain-containing histidine kinase [Desulfobulbaceae bacterium]|nr:HAMP domain-containing histidine kinase [Desulfobulbaceae bacterium]
MSLSDQKVISLSPTQGASINNFIWLLRLRWAIIASQAFLVLTSASDLQEGTSTWVISLLISIGLISNILLYGLLSPRKNLPNWVPPSVMFLDVALMTILYFQIISTLNPASILFMIYIVLGALLLEKKYSYGLTAFTIVCYGIFFYFGDPMLINEQILNQYNNLTTINNSADILPLLKGHLEEHSRSSNYFMLLVFFLISVLIVYPVAKMKEEMQAQQGAMKELEETRTRNDKLAALATFAAGAAHEFSTPLSTIAMASGEMMYYFKKHGGAQELIDDTRLIREQVSRCKEVLFQMSAKGGKHLGEESEKFSIKDLVNEAMALFNFENIQQINFVNQVDSLQIVMPVRTLTRTIRGLLKNALDASEPGSPIQLTCRKDKKFLYFEVQDRGKGMNGDFLKRATEPFFTSKEPGKGMGLGLYLANILVDRFDGDLKLESTPGLGTTATLSFSLERIEA